jgi:predicted enzyme related to lactoylglutathione lyase
LHHFKGLTQNFLNVDNSVKFVHTNLVARNWEKLAQFYIDVFNCEPIYPERDMSGEWIDRITSIKDVHIEGIHLKLPGYENGPTLEIFSYKNNDSKDNETYVNQYGFAHIAFHVTDVDAVLDRFLEHGGRKYGQLVEKEMKDLGILTIIYAKDPEGNIVEIQNWRQNHKSL